MDDRQVRSRSFGAAAAAYATYRPGYPDSAVDRALAGAPGPHVLDLAAGTGKLTSSLVARPDLRVTAVEPDPEMLAELRRLLPDVDSRQGTAEEIPLPDGSVDAIVIGQAWHWMDPARALDEFARVLRPGGTLAALWNRDDESVEWVAGGNAVLGLGPRGDGNHGFPAHPAFGPSELHTFRHAVPQTIDTMIANLSTHSWALAAEPAERDAALGRLRDYLASRPETASGTFEQPLCTDVLRAQRLRR
ncbi:class I SAM-dependent methyltransferase [Pseudonocardia sp. CA-107938]|uniref:class I SAM-dependent methyltransferase n=1 Tax=Pseudonocardia sp. CA-107938 TaxID=3240021 RepID=UPI003D8CE058